MQMHHVAMATRRKQEAGGQAFLQQLIAGAAVHSDAASDRMGPPLLLQLSVNMPHWAASYTGATGVPHT